MRAILLAVALNAGCGHPVDKTVDQFCTQVRLVFSPSIRLGQVRRDTSDLLARGRCSMLNEASHDLSITILGFEAAALPFRDRPEVGRTLVALDKLPQKEIFALHCYEGDEVPAAKIEALLANLDQVMSKLAAVTAACWSD